MNNNYTFSLSGYTDYQGAGSNDASQWYSNYYYCCPNCGASLWWMIGYVYCPYCGHKIVQEAEKPIEKILEKLDEIIEWLKKQ